MAKKNAASADYDVPEGKWGMASVTGTTQTDIDNGLGDTVTVSMRAYDPGYDLGASKKGLPLADIKRGYCSYGPLTGED